MEGSSEMDVLQVNACPCEDLPVLIVLDQWLGSHFGVAQVGAAFLCYKEQRIFLMGAAGQAHAYQREQEDQV